MRRLLAVNHKYIPVAAELAICLSVALLAGLSLSTEMQAQGPGLTTIVDTVYRADGTAASGSVLISWPSFVSAGGAAVAAGTLPVTIGAQGAFTAQLVPNAGASPAGTYYVAVFQLDDGTVRTEYWAVSTASPTTIAAVLTTPGTGLSNLAATQEYVNAAVAPLAVDARVVHLAGTEAITGSKQFTVPPSLPAPSGPNDGANKGYVDAAVANVGSGAYVAIAGGTMTGPLTLPADPAAPNQAADKNYIDNGLAVKADLVSGMVPSGELGAGVASSSTCLNGNSTWGPCGGGAPAGITYATTALNWTQTISSPLTGGTAATVTLTPCPVGVDTTSGAGYQVYVSGGGNSEAVNVVTAPGGCTSGATTGTITFTPFYSYAAGYTIGSASSGIQETLNAACGTDPTPWRNSLCNVTIPANGPGNPHSVNTYNIYGTIYLHSNQSVLSGYGTSLNCLGRGACLQLGDLVRSTDFSNNTVEGLSFRTPTAYWSNPAYAGVAIVQTQRASQVVTITTASPHGFRVGDMVTGLFTDSSAYWGDATVTAVPSTTSFQYAHLGADIPAQATPGVVALAYEAVLDNALNSHLVDIAYDAVGENGEFNNFFDLWDDENATIDHFNNQGISLNHSANWTGSFVFSAGNQKQQIAPVITLRDSSITANSSNGVTDYNSNGLYIENTVIQASGLWQVYSSNTKGNYQGAYIKNLYTESNTGLNPQSPARSPYPGLGIAGLIAGASSGAASFQVAGNGGPGGAFVSGGTGSTPYTYYIVVNDTTAGTQSSPLQVLNWLSTGSDTIPVNWPRVANGADVITYDVLRMTSPGGIGQNLDYPYYGGCPGGSGGTCGYVAKGLSQSSACSGGFVCSYTDSGSSSTSAYTVQIGTYSGNLAFWPGGLVSVGNIATVDNEVRNPVGVGLSGNPIQTAKQCSAYGLTSPGGYTSCVSSITAPPGGGVQNQSATILTDGGATGGGQALSKGRLTFSSTPFSSIAPHHIITLIDSQPALTQATPGYRPLASGNDTWIGTDVPSGGTGIGSGQLAFGAPVSITNYIGQTGDGIHANWLERLSGSLKEFNVATKFDQSVTIAGLTNGCLNIVSGLIASTGSPCGTGAGGGNVSSVFGRTGAVVAVSGDYTVSQVTGAAADAAVVHLANTETVTGAKTFTSNVAISGNLVLPQGSGYVPAVGGIGLDTAAGLPVVNIGGTNQQIALTSSNISGQAGTALALAGVPTQCAGSFATGIAANGNANCSTADVVQLAETAQPGGIPNWGVFWFDAATHTPRVIENNGQVMQLGLTNLFNSDPGGTPADNLEERNGGNAENFRVYSNYGDNSTWQRASIGFDGPDNYAVLRSENAASGSAPGLGFWIGSGLKWVIDAAGNSKPWTDNLLNLGSDSGNAAKSIFAKTSFNSVVYGRNDFEIPNDGLTGTVVNELAVLNANSPSQAVVAGTASSNGVIGVVQGGAGKSGNAILTWHGYAYCIFDNATVAGDAVVASTSVAGNCHDAGAGAQPSAQLIGYVDVTNATAGQTNGMRVGLQAAQGGGGAVSSVFGRTGAVSAATGDYSVGQVTGAAADAAVVHLAGAETITGAKTFASNVTVSGNLNVAGNINQTGSGPTQWSGQEWTGTAVTVPSGMAFSLGVGADNTFRCQLASGASCMPGGGSMVYPGAGIASSTGAGWGSSYGTSGGGSTLALTASPVFTGTPTVPGYVPVSTTVNGHALGANVAVSASDLTTGTLPHAQLPVLVSGDIPNNGANTTGTAGNLGGPATLPSGTVLPGYAATATLVSGNYTKATGAGAIGDSGVAAGPYAVPWAISSYTGGSTTASFNSVNGKAQLWGFGLTFAEVTTQFSYYVQTADTGNCSYDIGILNTSGNVAGSGNAHLGNTGAAAGGFNSVGWHTTALAGSSMLQPGKYYVALTASATSGCAVLGAGSMPTFLSNTAETVNSGGTLNNGITIPADVLAVGAVPSIYLR
ncbi:MAG: hypothetical protein WAM89_00255 [Terriglobales bacterium]